MSGGKSRLSNFFLVETPHLSSRTLKQLQSIWSCDALPKPSDRCTLSTFKSIKKLLSLANMVAGDGFFGWKQRACSNRYEEFVLLGNLVLDLRKQLKILWWAQICWFQENFRQWLAIVYKHVKNTKHWSSKYLGQDAKSQDDILISRMSDLWCDFTDAIKSKQKTKSCHLRLFTRFDFKSIYNSHEKLFKQVPRGSIYNKI